MFTLFPLPQKKLFTLFPVLGMIDLGLGMIPVLGMIALGWDGDSRFNHCVPNNKILTCDDKTTKKKRR